MCVSKGAKWFNVGLWSNWLWNQFPLRCSYRYRCRYRTSFEEGAPWHSDNWCRFTLTHVCDMIGIQLKMFCHSTVLSNYILEQLQSHLVRNGSKWFLFTIFHMVTEEIPSPAAFVTLWASTWTIVKRLTSSFVQLLMKLDCKTKVSRG